MKMDLSSSTWTPAAPISSSTPRPSAAAARELSNPCRSSITRALLSRKQPRLLSPFSSRSVSLFQLAIIITSECLGIRHRGIVSLIMLKCCNLQVMEEKLNETNVEAARVTKEGGYQLIKGAELESIIKELDA